MSIKDYRTKDEIIIEIDGAGESGESGDDRNRKGAVVFDKPTDYLPRRLRPGFEYNLFDFGRLASGADIPFYKAPAVSYDSKFYPTALAPFVAGDWAALQSYILGFNETTYKENFKRIEPDVIKKYDIRIRDKNNVLRIIDNVNVYSKELHGFEYSEGKIKFNDSIDYFEIRSALCASVFPPENIEDDLKITDSPSAAAPAVDFNYKKNTDWFLMPRVAIETGRSYVTFYTTIGSIGFGTYRTGVLSLIYRPVPRTVYLKPFFAGGSETVYLNPTDFGQVKSAVAALPGGRFLINTTRAQANTTQTLYVSNQTAGGGQFPNLNPDSSPNTYATAGVRWAPSAASIIQFPLQEPPIAPRDAARFQFATMQTDDPAAFTLVAIAQQNDKTYYFWNSPEFAGGVLTSSLLLTAYGAV